LIVPEELGCHHLFANHVGRKHFDGHLCFLEKLIDLFLHNDVLFCAEERFVMLALSFTQNGQRQRTKRVKDVNLLEIVVYLLEFAHTVLRRGRFSSEV